MKAAFKWDDPLLLDAQLGEDERMVREAARAYCQDKLAPRVLEAFRHEKTDPAIFNVWPEFVATGDDLFHFEPMIDGSGQISAQAQRGLELIREGKKIIEWVAFARVPMPKTARNFLDRCDAYAADLRLAARA